MIKWAAITFGIGLVLVVIEYVVAARKRGGVTPTDRRRCLGIFWLAVFAAGLVGSIVRAVELIS